MLVLLCFWVGRGDPCTLRFQPYVRERRSQRLLMCHKSLQGFVWIWCVQQMIVNFSSSKVIHSVYPRLLHIISMQRGNGRSNYCGLQTWHPPSLRQPLPSWWDSVWAFTRLLPNEFPLKLRTELFKSKKRNSGCLNESKTPLRDRKCVCVCR